MTHHAGRRRPTVFDSDNGKAVHSVHTHVFQFYKEPTVVCGRPPHADQSVTFIRATLEDVSKTGLHE
jgi:hypothetical protein